MKKILKVLLPFFLFSLFLLPASAEGTIEDGLDLFSGEEETMLLEKMSGTSLNYRIVTAEETEAEDLAERSVVLRIDGDQEVSLDISEDLTAVFPEESREDLAWLLLDALQEERAAEGCLQLVESAEAQYKTFSEGAVALPSVRNSEKQYVVDMAYLLTEEEAADLNERLRTLSEKWDADIVVVTTNDNGGLSTMAYADDFFDYNGYGRGAQRSGVLLLTSMDTSEVWISTCGYGITAFTDYGIDLCLDEIIPYLSDGDYAGSYRRFAEIADEYFQAAQDGRPVDIYPEEPEPEPDPVFEPFSAEAGAGSVAGGLGVGLLSTLRKRARLKSVRSREYAEDYVRDDSFDLTRSQDIYLYRNISRMRIQSSSSSSHGGHSGGGGSHVHISSSGSFHGGGGRKF
ncbi:MAG: TPM domain-containing protein [Erysipelotrichaceae bacterium]|nr:TPM domain-containing protein [Erysipelotrichaceae bacterium]